MGIITLILLATEATESPLTCAVNAMTLKMLMKRNPSTKAPKNHSEPVIDSKVTLPLYSNNPVMQAVI